MEKWVWPSRWSWLSSLPKKADSRVLLLCFSCQAFFIACFTWRQCLHLPSLGTRRIKDCDASAQLHPCVEPQEESIDDPSSDFYARMGPQLLEALAFLRASEAFACLPAASRRLAATFRDEVRGAVARNLLWPAEGPASAAFWPSTALPGSAGTKDIEALESVLSDGLQSRHLERLFLWSIRDSWSRKDPSDQPSSTSSGCQSMAGGPVLWAARRCRGAREAREIAWLLRWKADPNQTDQTGWTPLIWVAHRNAPDLCKVLIRGRADLDHIGKEGSTALSIASRCANTEVVKTLLEAGASPFLVPIGNGNFDYHVGEEAMELIRKARRQARRAQGREFRM